MKLCLNSWYTVRNFFLFDEIFKGIFMYLSFIRDELITCFLDHFLADFTDIIIILGVRIGTPNTINAMASGLTF